MYKIQVQSKIYGAIVGVPFIYLCYQRSKVKGMFRRNLLGKNEHEGELHYHFSLCNLIESIHKKNTISKKILPYLMYFKVEVTYWQGLDANNAMSITVLLLNKKSNVSNKFLCNFKVWYVCKWIDEPRLFEQTKTCRE